MDETEIESPVAPHGTGSGLYIVAIVAILFIAGIGAVFSSDPAMLLTMCGTVIVSFLSLLQIHIKTRDSFNSKLDQYITLTQEAYFARGEESERTKIQDERSAATNG